MKITAIWFTCSRDRDLVEVSMESLRRIFGIEWEFVTAVDAADDFEEIPGARLLQTGFNRGANLNGRYCVKGMIGVMRQCAPGSDYVLKIDSDVIARNDSWRSLLTGQSWAMIGGSRETAPQTVWGGAYFLSSQSLLSLPVCIDARLDDANRSTGKELELKWPEDETMSALWRVIYPEATLMVRGAPPLQGWLTRYDYGNPGTYWRGFDFVEFGGEKWKLPPAGNWERPEIIAQVKSAMMAALPSWRVTDEKPSLSHEPTQPHLRKPQVACLSFGDWACFSPLVKHFERRGYAVHRVNEETVWDVLPALGVLIVWNGGTDTHKPILERAKAFGVKVLFCELGFFPQRDFIFIDTKGIGPDSSLMDDDLSWLTGQQKAAFQNFRRIYAREKLGSDYVLVPLQLEIDLQWRMHSPIPTMQGLIDHCVELFEGQTVVFKRHPRDNSNYDMHGRQLITEGNVLTYGRNASLVYGVNSTALLECAMIEGQEVIAIGDGYLQKPEPRDDILAALCALQVRQDCEQLPEFLIDRLGI